MVLVDTWY